MNSKELARYMNHQIQVKLTPAAALRLRAESGSLTGRVTNVSKDGIVLSARSTVTIIAADEIDEVRIRRGRVVVRMVRVFSDRDDVRQHLADRHGVWVGLLRSLTPDSAHIYHEKIDHSDLGHQHGERTPGTQVVDPVAANEAMEQLDEMELD